MNTNPSTESQELTRTEEWNVIVWNDPINLMDYVSYVFRSVFSYSEPEAHFLMMRVHLDGKALVWSGSREQAEFYVTKMHQHQLTATISESEE